MNNTIRIAVTLVSLVVISCSKKEDKPTDVKTFGIVVNTSSANLENVLVGYFDNHLGKTILLKSLDDVTTNSSSVKFEISNEKVIPELYVYFNRGEVAFMVVPTFQLYRHMENSFIIDDVKVRDAYNVETDGPYYPH